MNTASLGKSRTLLLLSSALLIAVGAAQADITPEAAALAKAVGAKIGSAQTIKLTAKHKLDPALAIGAGHENGPMLFTVKRPNQFYVLQPAGNETRELAYNGKELCLMHPMLGHHGLAPLKANSVEAIADAMDARFGFRPPVAELLAADAAKQLLLHVSHAAVLGKERVGFTLCERLHFVQEGMTGDLWVSVKDKLPRRYLLTFTSLPGKPTWDIKLSKWELNVPVDESLFSKRPPADSQKIPMLKSR